MTGNTVAIQATGPAQEVKPDSPRVHPGSPRRYDIDRLRVFGILCLFFFHCSLPFACSYWNCSNNEKSTVLFYFVRFVQSWRLPLLMLVAGSASWFVLKRRTAGQYVCFRARRLLVPLYTIGFFLLAPLQKYWMDVARGDTADGYIAFLGQFVRTINFSVGYHFLEYWSAHLWFLRTLFIYTLLSLPVFLLLKQEWGRRALSWLAKHVDRPGGAFLLIVPTLLTQVIFFRFLPEGEAIAGVLYFFYFFIAGYMLVADAQLSHGLASAARIAFPLGILTFCTMMILLLQSGDMAYSADSHSLLRRAVGGVNTWCWLIVFLRLAECWGTGGSKVLSHMNEAVMPFYVIHQTAIVGIGLPVVRWSASVPVKFLVITIVSFVLTAGLHVVFIRPYIVMRFLFGMAPQSRIEAQPCRTGAAAQAVG